MDREYIINQFYLEMIPRPYSIAFVTINTVISLMVIILNSLLCFAIWKLKLYQITSYRFILALAISDLFTGAVIQPLYSLEFANTFRGSHFAQDYLVMLQFFAYILGQYSGLMVVTISIDRYLHMKHLVNYNIYMTSKRAKFLMLFNIVLSIALEVVQTSSIFVGFYVYARIFILTVNILVSLSGISLYLSTFLTTKNRVESLNLSSNISSSTTRNFRKVDLQFAKGILVLLISLALCYFPYFLTAIILSVKIMQKNKRNDIGLSFYIFFYCTFLLMFMVPLINSIVLCVFNRAVRRYLAALILRKKGENS